jgi:hypothetical protein
MGRVVAEGEPLWLDEDRDWALALAAVEAEECPDCHQPWDQASARENSESYRASIARCHACAAAAAAVNAHEKAGGKTAGLKVHIIPPTR